MAFVKFKIASIPLRIYHFLENNLLQKYFRQCGFHIKKYAEDYQYCFFGKESLRLAINFTWKKGNGEIMKNPLFRILQLLSAGFYAEGLVCLRKTQITTDQGLLERNYCLQEFKKMTLQHLYYQVRIYAEVLLVKVHLFTKKLEYHLEFLFPILNSFRFEFSLNI